MMRNLQLLEYALVLVSVLGISMGQVLLKTGAVRIRNGNDWFDSVLSLLNWQLMVGVAVLGFSTLLWIYLLRSIPLSVAYPFMALAFIFVPLMSHFLLGELLTSWRLIGACLIIAGVILSSRQVG